MIDLPTCDVCGKDEKVVLTKHHYTGQEMRILNIKRVKGQQKWVWRCANCHMAFNRLGPMKFYEKGGYWDRHKK